MTRPHIIRADTIDLQDHDAPSAKDHPRGPHGSLGPHQAATLQEIAQESAEIQARSPRLSFTDGDDDDVSDSDDLADEVSKRLNGGAMDDASKKQQDALAIAQNGGTSGNSDDGDMDDTDESLDDDMMDKISSSPSIEDDWEEERSDKFEDKFGLENVAQHGPIVVRPLRLRGSSSEDFAQRRAEMERAEWDEAAEANLDDDHDEHDSDFSLMIPYEPSIEDDDDDFSFSDDSRFIAGGWGNECLHEAEDIDFEFVYALHTFVATVEGQANATKGDTMVLLDDSNSYWWLVRVVKDSSIGYLPAEHIETPTERLARLNKHRNIDVVAPSQEEMNLSDLDQLSATMLGDQAGEKSKSTFKTALRKKKKTVAFAPPTFVDYSDIDYSSDEEDMEEMFSQQQGQQQQQQQQQAATQQSTEEAEDETAKVEPLKPRTIKEVKVAEPTKKEEVAEDDGKRDSGEIFEKPEGPSRSRNGTVRNTDSFFKDETVETKKITLTPNLLRDDNSSRPSTTESVKQRPSLDKLDKELQPDKKDDKKKKDKDKKEKDKKPSAIRSFFSRKDKKKVVDDDDESFGKRSMDIVTESQDRESEEQPSSPRTSGGSSGGPERTASKLTKQQPRVEPSLSRKGATTPQKSATRELSEFISSEGRPNNVSNVPPASMRIVEDDSSDVDAEPKKAETKHSQKSSLSKIMPSRSSEPKEPKPQKVTKAKSRVELDDFDSSGEEIDPSGPSVQQPTEEEPKDEKLVRPVPGAFPDSYMSGESAQTDRTITPSQPMPQSQPTAADREKDRLSESPVQVSPVTTSNPPALMVDTSSQDGHSSSPSPELIDADEVGRHRAQDSMTASSTSTGGSTTGSSWNDAKLRAFFDSSSDIRDMLVVVYDKSDVAPAGPDHPVAGSLFREQNAKLAEITTQLDNMLGDWLARKQRLRGTV
ncbi:Tip elongation aberrant protein Tea4 [Colletotrichum sp. SAR 10_70]|nr:Tip elongation aberrant protein Tea4 [Colletotrichum sp. SAR 10_71]KAI8186130.1 Tip elongation aberrant protein Tea4 [Colletotrichum sp. SAR 10_70]KAI8186245.1 Tip elongation aberrant protein Tea4 [Colletotrichum sp. SAR 10_75]KAI8189999.1 Tip elongation aberrant protein Tea4 [Colletotrichum sp. SAR 10_65]KAI8259602.1 Tip elongation aberrant protein Tea4 [Colletotrichum sp. SAR 10_77]